MSDRTARVLVNRLEELSSAALLSGADAAAVARLLESASLATLHAVSLSYLCEEPLHEVTAVAQRPVLTRLLDAA
jgi:2-methylcitrate dehydratase PrpD